MSKRIVFLGVVAALFAVLGGLALFALNQQPAQVLFPKTSAKTAESVLGADDGWYGYIIPPADLGQVLNRAEAASARAAEQSARVQAVIDYLHAHNRFPPRTRAFDSAQQVVMDYIRINQRIPSSAAQVESPVKAVLDYIRTNHAMPPHPAPVDPAVQAVMDYIRIYGKVPTSAAAVQ
jgi:hypothetical protein